MKKFVIWAVILLIFVPLFVRFMLENDEHTYEKVHNVNVVWEEEELLAAADATVGILGIEFEKWAFLEDSETGALCIAHYALNVGNVDFGVQAYVYFDSAQEALTKVRYIYGERRGLPHIAPKSVEGTHKTDFSQFGEMVMRYHTQ